MKAVEQAKAQKAVDKIQNNNFDENDIDGLFMRLRAYSHGHKALREFADLVAHNDQRDRGMTNTYLEGMYLNGKFLGEYRHQKRPLDITKPFPLYVKKLMKYQVDKAEEKFLREKFSVTPKQLKSQIDNLFAEDKKTDTAYPTKVKVDSGTVGALQHLFSFLKVEPVITQALLIDQLISVLRKNQIAFDEATIRQMAPRITLCALLLLHEVRFDFGGPETGYCLISFEKKTPPESIGPLKVLGHVVLDKEGKNFDLCFEVMSTTLKTDKWCDTSAIDLESFNNLGPGQPIRLVGNLCLGTDFKLIRM
jgi:hypothetical protein